MADRIPAVPAPSRQAMTGLLAAAQRPGGTAAPARLSFGQERLWFMQQLFPRSWSYHVPAAFRLRGNLDIDALRYAFTELVRRHEILRTRYASSDDGELTYLVDQAEPFGMNIFDVPDGSAEKCAELISARAREPFDLGTGPVIRADLFRITGADHVLLVNIHHIASDAWSLAILAQEISALYAGADLAPLARQYPDYASWQRGRLAGGAEQRHVGYWRRELAGLIPLSLPGDRARPDEPAFRGARARVALGEDLAGRVRALGRDCRVTLFAVMTAALQVLLGRYCGRDDVAVGSSVADRGRPEFEELIGFCVNTVVLRTDLSGDPAFAAVARRVQAAALAAHDHLDLPFERLVEELAPDRSLSQMPLFGVAMTYISTPPVRLRLPGLEVGEFAFESGIVRYDLDCFVFDAGADINFEVDYRTDLYDAATIERMLREYVRLLGEAASAPQAPVSSLGPGVVAGAAVVGAAVQTGRDGAERGRGGDVGEVERRVGALFDEIFGRRGSGPADDFFALGGHSLLAIKLINRIRQEFGVEPSLRCLFTSSTVARLAGQVGELLAAGRAGAP